MAASSIILFFFFWLNSIPLYMYHIFFIHSSADEYLGFFYVLAIVNSAAMDIGVHVSFQIVVLCDYMLRNRIAGSYGNSAFSIFEEPPYCSP